MDFNWSQVISIIAGALVTLGLAWIKGYYDRKATDVKIENKEKEQDAKLAAQVKTVLQEIKGISVTVVEIREQLSHHMQESDFLRDLEDSIQTKSKQFLYSSLGLEQKYKNILGYWTDIISKIGENYYKNKSRKKDKTTLRKELEQDINRELDDFNNYINDVVKDVKFIKGKKHYFSKYLEEYQIHNKTHLLISRLVDNGFKTTDNILKVFTEYIDGYFSSFATAISIWESAEDYSFEKEKVA